MLKINLLKKIRFTLIILILLKYKVNLSSTAATDKGGSSKPKCVVRAKDPVAMESILDNCIESLNIKVPTKEFASDEEVIKYYDDLEKSGFDDKCLGKCLAEKHGILTPDSHISKESLLILKEANNASAEAKDILKNIWLDCADKVESKAEMEGGLKNNECKYMAMFDHCSFTEHFKRRDEIRSLC